MLVLLFTVITVIANLITVFSVISNLSIFVSNHSVEINILRAIGFTKRHIYIAYSFCCCYMNRYLVITASIMLSPLLCGMGAGILIAFIICKQESLIIDIPLGFKVNSVISCNNLQSDLWPHSILISICICLAGQIITTVSSIRKVLSIPIAQSLKAVSVVSSQTQYHCPYSTLLSSLPQPH